MLIARRARILLKIINIILLTINIEVRIYIIETRGSWARRANPMMDI